MTEYILLLAVILGFFMILIAQFSQRSLGEALMAPITNDYRRAYQLGHPQAKGFEEIDGGVPQKHPRALEPDKENFRIFVNPRSR